MSPHAALTLLHHFAVSPRLATRRDAVRQRFCEQAGPLVATPRLFFERWWLLDIDDLEPLLPPAHRGAYRVLREAPLGVYRLEERAVERTVKVVEVRSGHGVWLAAGRVAQAEALGSGVAYAQPLGSLVVMRLISTSNGALELLQGPIFNPAQGPTVEAWLRERARGQTAFYQRHLPALFWLWRLLQVADPFRQ